MPDQDHVITIGVSISYWRRRFSKLSCGVHHEAGGIGKSPSLASGMSI
jgi:hypothetical protein